MSYASKFSPLQLKNVQGEFFSWTKNPPRFLRIAALYSYQFQFFFVLVSFYCFDPVAESSTSSFNLNGVSFNVYTVSALSHLFFLWLLA